MSLSLTAQEIIAKRKRNIEEREKSAKNNQDQKQDTDPQDNDENQPEDNQPEDNVDDTDPNNTDDNQPEDNQPEDGSDEEGEVDYKQKFERLRQKQSGIEKSKAQLAKEKEELAEKNRALQAELEKERQQLRDDAKKNPAEANKPGSQADTTQEEVDAYLAKELGDDWEFMDESEKRTTRFLAKQTLDLKKQAQNNPDPASSVEKVVAKKLAEEKQQALINDFNKDMDKFVDGLDKGSTFHEVVNEPDFDRYLKENRVARAMFVEAANNVDAEAKTMMQDVISGYMGKQVLAPKVTKKGPTSPDVKSPTKPQPKKKKAAVSEENIAWARKNLKRAGPLREKALAIMTKAKQAGLI